LVRWFVVFLSVLFAAAMYLPSLYFPLSDQFQLSLNQDYCQTLAHISSVGKIRLLQVIADGRVAERAGGDLISGTSSKK
jgi:hypothetical protein